MFFLWPCGRVVFLFSFSGFAGLFLLKKNTFLLAAAPCSARFLLIPLCVPSAFFLRKSFILCAF